MKIAAILFILCFSLTGKTQSTYVADEDGNIFSVDLAKGCAASLLYSCRNGDIVDIAADQHSNIYICSRDSLFIFDINNPSRGCVFILKFSSQVSGLLVAADGNVYASGGRLFRYNPVANTLTDLGNFPPDVYSAGDMIEYNGKIYMSASDAGLYELNLAAPSLSTFYCRVGSQTIWGMALVSTRCYGEIFPRYRVLAFAQSAGFASGAFLIDMENKFSFPDYCQLNISVMGATSVAASDVTAGPIQIAAVALQAPFCSQTSDGKISLTMVVENAANYSYSINGGADVGRPVFENLSEGSYTIRIKNQFGCFKDTTLTFPYSGINCVDTVFIPSAFTPDGNGNNDIFRSRSLVPVSNFELRIYNRYGENVFTSYDVGRGWDGGFRSKQQPAGVYVWFVRYRSYFGRNVMRKGTVALIR